MTLGAAVFVRSARVAHGKGAAATGTRHVRAQPPDRDRRAAPSICRRAAIPPRPRSGGAGARRRASSRSRSPRSLKRPRSSLRRRRRRRRPKRSCTTSSSSRSTRPQGEKRSTGRTPRRSSPLHYYRTCGRRCTCTRRLQHLLSARLRKNRHRSSSTTARTSRLGLDPRSRSLKPRARGPRPCDRADDRRARRLEEGPGPRGRRRRDRGPPRNLKKDHRYLKRGKSSFGGPPRTRPT